MYVDFWRIFVRMELNKHPHLVLVCSFDSEFSAVAPVAVLGVLPVQYHICLRELSPTHLEQLPCLEGKNGTPNKTYGWL